MTTSTDPTSRVALVRPPGPRLAQGQLTHIARQPVDLSLAVRQWETYVEAFEDAHWDVVRVPAADDCPDAVFVEDTMVLFRNVAVIGRPGAESRRPEIAEAERAIESLGCSINRIRPPGTLEGGDVLKIGDRVFVGSGDRTNAAGIAQLRTILEPLGATVAAVPHAKVLHLKSMVTALPDGTVVGHEPLVDDARAFERFLPVEEETGAHVVLLGGPKLLMAADCPRTAERFADFGYEPAIVDISEFQKLEGCVTCLSVRVRHLVR